MKICPKCFSCAFCEIRKGDYRCSPWRARGFETIPPNILLGEKRCHLFKPGEPRLFEGMKKGEQAASPELTRQLSLAADWKDRAREKTKAKRR